MEWCVLFIFIFFFDCFVLVFIVVLMFFFFKPFLSFFYRKFYNDGTQFLFFLFSSKTYVLLFTYAWKKVRLFKKKKKFFFGGLILLFHLNKVQLFIFSWFIKFFFLLANKPSVRKKKRKANKTKTFPIFLQNLKMSWDCINYWKFVYIFNA